MTDLKMHPRRPIGVMWKTVSEACNLACDYCYYSTCGGKPTSGIHRIDPAVLEKFMIDYFATSPGMASFVWQGGEPLLAGLNFFRKVVALQRAHAPKGYIVSNSVQTNGTLITDRWAQFFKENRFLVGVSLDGPEAVHNARRVDAIGRGSYRSVMRGIDRLRQHQVDFNILSVVHKGNVGRATELLSFFEKEGFTYIQFIPCMDFRSQQPDKPGVYEITPEEYGEFLCEAFDYWYNDGNPRFSIRFFDNMLLPYANREAELCVNRANCPDMLILEQNGDAYPCDFYISKDWKIGNAATDSIEEMLNHPAYRRFHQMKPSLPEACKTCQWLRLCHGGCPRNRGWDVSLTPVDRDYFCESYKMIYAYADEKIRALGNRVRSQLFHQNVQLYLKGKAPRRNDPCPCGSGKKYKHCCMERV
ncbi:anaerobic sulfatase maturase [Sporolactobacillus sp. THM7-7]|nr:anaerobic sulfatase maturase [Sporolactobacillus sp. THM7-7]